MRCRCTLIALSLVGVLSACTAGRDQPSHVGKAQEALPAQLPDPMASFARMVPGEWRTTALAGTSTFDTWHWGPGQHSMRVTTDGAAPGGDPWRELQVFYWHPGRKQVRMLGLSPFGRGVSEGDIKFDGETADGVFDLYQIYGRRKMGLRWAFDGPDKYHDVLLETTGPEGLRPVNGWDHFRSLTPRKEPDVPIPTAGEKAPKLSDDLRVFKSLLGHTWQATGNRTTAGASQIQTTFEWVPYTEGIYVRVDVLTGNPDPAHLLDAYFYYHAGIKSVRCLALSSQGEVYEGDVTVLEGGSLQFDLKGYEGERVTSYAVRLDFNQDGTLRQRVWSVQGADRALLHDIHHQKVKRAASAVKSTGAASASRQAQPTS